MLVNADTWKMCIFMKVKSYVQNTYLCTKYISTKHFKLQYFKKNPILFMEDPLLGRNTCFSKRNGHNKSENDQYVVANVWLMGSRPLGPFICLFIHTTMR